MVQDMNTSTATGGPFSCEDCFGNGSSRWTRYPRKPTSRREAKANSSMQRWAREEDEEESVEFDTSDTDNNNELLLADRHYPSIQEFASAIPNQLLLGSLLEHLCFVYEKNPTRSHMLFKVIGQRLAAMKLLSPLAISDEFSTVRLQHNRAFTELLNATTSSLYPQGPGTSLSSRPEEGLFQAQTSRYLSEFNEICRLGKGAYGNVFKVMNKLDGQYYAVKKILIKKVLKEDCVMVLREVKVLSSLQHVNVVGYHTAWMEHVQPALRHEPLLPALESPELDDNTDDSLSIVFQSLSEASTDAAVSDKASASESASVKALVPALENGQLVCSKPTRLIPENYVPCVFLGHQGPLKNAKCPAKGWDSSELLEEDSGRVELNDKSCISEEWEERADACTATSSPEGQFHLMLYIQMQMCERSLRDWITERNEKPKEEQCAKCPYGDVNAEHTLSLFKNILEGVDYIHSKRIIHRDLKPRNIFLHAQDRHVRIGDFGLACEKKIADGNKSTVSPLCGSHTGGVGTFVYAAPEQLNGSHYDSKSDMYSLGVVALELFHPFGTEMERVQILGDLREGKIPDSFCQRWPVLSQYIMRLTSKEPSVRPTASQLLQSELFCNKDMVIHGLQRRVEEQEEEIIQLRRRISELQISKVTAKNPELDKM